MHPGDEPPFLVLERGEARLFTSGQSHLNFEEGIQSELKSRSL
jgi:hypothetical protein